MDPVAASSSSTAAAEGAQRRGHSPRIERSDAQDISSAGPASTAQVGRAPSSASTVPILRLDRSVVAPGSAAVLQQGVREAGELDEGAPKNWWIALALDRELDGKGLPMRRSTNDNASKFGVRLNKPDHAGVVRTGRLVVEAQRDGAGLWHLVRGRFHDEQAAESAEDTVTTVPLAKVRDDGLATSSLDWAIDHEDDADGSQYARVARAVYAAIEAGGFSLQPAAAPEAALQLRARVKNPWPEGHAAAGHPVSLVAAATLVEAAGQVTVMSKFEIAGAVLVDETTGQVVAQACLTQRLQAGLVAPSSLAVLRRGASSAALTSDEAAQLMGGLLAALEGGQLQRVPAAVRDEAVLFKGQIELPGDKSWEASVTVAMDEEARLHLAGLHFRPTEGGETVRVNVAKRLFSSVVAPASTALLDRCADNASFEHRPVAQALRDLLAGGQLRQKQPGFAAPAALPDGRRGQLHAHVAVNDSAQLQLTGAVFQDEAAGRAVALPLLDRLLFDEVEPESLEALNRYILDPSFPHGGIAEALVRALEGNRLVLASAPGRSLVRFELKGAVPDRPEGVLSVQVAMDEQAQFRLVEARFQDGAAAVIHLPLRASGG